MWKPDPRKSPLSFVDSFTANYQKCRKLVQNDPWILNKTVPKALHYTFFDERRLWMID
jgi:hypothetical protein